MAVEQGRPRKISLEIEAGPGMDADSLDRLTRQLYRELAELDIDSVDFVDAGQAPPGTKAIGGVSAGKLTVSAQPASVPRLVEYLQSWTMRAEDRSVKLQALQGSRTVELKYQPDALTVEQHLQMVKSISEFLENPGSGEQGGAPLEKND